MNVGKSTSAAWQVPIIIGMVLGALLGLVAAPTAHYLKAYWIDEELQYLAIMLAVAGWAVGLLWNSLATREVGKPWAMRALPLIIANLASIVAVLMALAHIIVFRRYDELLFLGFYCMIVVNTVALTVYAVFPWTTAGYLDRWIGRRPGGKRIVESTGLSIAGRSNRALLGAGLAILALGAALAVAFSLSQHSPRFVEEIFAMIGLAASLVIFHGVAAADWLVVYLSAKRADREQLKTPLRVCWQVALALVIIVLIIAAVAVFLDDRAGFAIILPVVVLAFLGLVIGAAGLLAHLYAIGVLFSRQSRTDGTHGPTECVDEEDDA